MWNDTPCLVWTGDRDRWDYGVRMVGGKRGRLVHRLAWEEANGPIPDGLFVLHHCDNPPCYEPTHLFLGTQQDNINDMMAKGRHFQTAQTHCKRGHEFNEKNTYVFFTATGSMRRKCRVCNLYHQRKVQMRKREVQA